MIPLWVEMIGVIAGFLGVIAWFPQIRRVWSEKKHDGISLPTFTLVSTSLMIWLVYGIMIESVAMILANIAALSCIFAIIAGVLKLRREE
ncbi:MAG: SemiSWEET family transporter [Candidatus Thalassarchaeum sp.]|nr:SemiSWEET family transporter [Candidatus Thalassarchaeum sp.]MCS5531445.1 SemiSWEET family transporter [Candidatus Poseidoniales archaeon]MEC8938464.1 SemiSWEET family transporter [Candidatus Thermoplasmatota archaeon]MEC8954764.1 SemiSWEET family transporter [Candidatus Thermoplasmatota archaeon]MEC9350520.1 SemiSWEET family transporter [Candidatus Thermoplasmatota archaeon]|tara:strand:+ start:1095 stop:1364 length:270 start_codon:yes stop_codon:yes gene_type:complete